MVCVTKAAGTRPTSLIGTRPLARAFRPGDRTWRSSTSGCTRNSSSAPHMETKSERWAERKIWRKPRKITPRPAPSRRRDGGRHFCKRPNRDRAINIEVRQGLEWRSPGALRQARTETPDPARDCLQITAPLPDRTHPRGELTVRTSHGHEFTTPLVVVLRFSNIDVDLFESDLLTIARRAALSKRSTCDGFATPMKCSWRAFIRHQSLDSKPSVSSWHEYRRR